MSTFILLPSGFIAPSNFLASVNAFARLGVWRVHALMQWPKITRTINQYKVGAIDSVQFKDNICQLFPKLKSVSDEAFWQAWNKSCDFNSLSKERLDGFIQRDTKDVSVFVIGRTNPAHMDFIRQQYGKSLPGHWVLSYDEGILGPQLTEIALEQINKVDPDAAVFHVANKPPTFTFPYKGSSFYIRGALFTALTALAIFSPVVLLAKLALLGIMATSFTMSVTAGFKWLEQKEKDKAYAAIVQQSKTKGFGLVDWSTNNLKDVVLQVKLGILAKSRSDVCDKCELVGPVDIEDLGKVYVERQATKSKCKPNTSSTDTTAAVNPADSRLTHRYTH